MEGCSVDDFWRIRRGYTVAVAIVWFDRLSAVTLPTVIHIYTATVIHERETLATANWVNIEAAAPTQLPNLSTRPASWSGSLPSKPFYHPNPLPPTKSSEPQNSRALFVFPWCLLPYPPPSIALCVASMRGATLQPSSICCVLWSIIRQLAGVGWGLPSAVQSEIQYEQCFRLDGTKHTKFVCIQLKYFCLDLVYGISARVL